MLGKLQSKISTINWSKQLFLLVFSFFNVHIYMIQHNQIKGGLDYAILIFNILVLTAILSMVWKAAAILWDRAGIKVVDEKRENMSDKKYFLVTWGVQMLCWIPVFLACYPGIVHFDAVRQIGWTFGSFSTHHPLAYTLYLHFFYYIIGGDIFHNYNTGVAMSTFAQMLFLSGALGYMHLFLRRLSVKMHIRLGIVCFFSIFPYIALMAITTTKDIIFAGFMLLLMTSLGYWARQPEYCKSRCYKAVFIVSAIGTILFRNNGIYVVSALLLVAIILSIKKQVNYRFPTYILIGFVLGIAILMGLRFGLQAKSGSSNEMLSVPYQQMARIYKYNKGSLSKAEKKKIKLIIPKVEKYNEYISDRVKTGAKAGKYKQDFIKTYINLVPSYPGTAVTAVSLTNAGYLSLTDMSSRNIYGLGPVPVGITPLFGVKRDSFFPQLEQLYKNLFAKKDLVYRNVLGLNILCSLALYFWMLVWLMIKVVKEKRQELFPMVAFMAVFLLTMLAGPCALTRYALPYILALPVLWGCVITHKID